MSHRDDASLRHRQRRRQHLLRQALPDSVNLDIMRGWRETHDRALRRPHRLPELGRLIHADEDTLYWPIHGPRVLLGRYHAQSGPVDIGLSELLDHELYRLGAPHACMTREASGTWSVMRLTSTKPVRVGEHTLPDLYDTAPLTDGDLLTLGVTRLRFRAGEQTYATWRTRLHEMLREVTAPALCLKRAGAPCGVVHLLDPETPHLLGAGIPPASSVAIPERWGDLPTLDWDMSALYDEERRHLAACHARIQFDAEADAWTLTPVHRRHTVTLNRAAPTARAITLEPGDEVGMGSMVCHFHHPDALPEDARDLSLKRPQTRADWDSNILANRAGVPRQSP